MNFRLRFLGLRLGRLRAWWRVVTDGDSRPGAREWLKMARLVLRRLVGHRRSPPARARIVAAYRVCCRCPLHDPTLRRCGGCNCYMPFKLAAGAGCWARETDPGSTLGFSVAPRSDPAPGDGRLG